MLSRAESTTCSGEGDLEYEKSNPWELTYAVLCSVFSFYVRLSGLEVQKKAVDYIRGFVILYVLIKGRYYVYLVSQELPKWMKARRFRSPFSSVVSWCHSLKM